MRNLLCLAVILGTVGIAVSARSIGAAEPPTAAPAFKDVKEIISARCVPCHSEAPDLIGVYDAPGGIKYDTADEIRTYSAGIGKTVADGTMPDSNYTNKTEGERKVIAAWVAAGAKVP